MKVGDGYHYIFKEAGWQAAKPVLMGVSGEGAASAVAAFRHSDSRVVAAEMAANTKWGGRAVTALRVGGRVLLVAGVAASVYKIYTAENRTRQVTIEVGGWVGAAAGAAAGGKVGAVGGAGVGSFFGGVGAAPGAAVGGTIGAVGGAVGGFYAGEAVTETVYDWAFDPGFALRSNQ